MRRILEHYRRQFLQGLQCPTLKGLPEAVAEIWPRASVRHGGDQRRV
jgi:hypothetical protein